MSGEPLLTPVDLAETYHSHAYETAWEIVEDYQRVLEYTGRNPNASSHAVARTLRLPRERLRPWMDGSIPDVVRGIQTAESRDWIPLTEDSDTFPALNKLVAWQLSKGTLKDPTYAPYFFITDDTHPALEQILNSLSLEYEIERSQTTDRSTEVRVSTDGSVLGRVLWLLGAPLDGERLDTTPAYLSNVSKEAQREFARIYLQNRGQYWAFTDRWVIPHQYRQDYYRRSLATLFRTLGADVETHEDTVSIDNEFVSTLQTES